MLPSEMSQWLKDNAGIRALRVAVPDLNGQARGKRIPIGHADKAIEGAMRFPLSALNLDIWGQDIANSPLLFETGDQDGAMRPTERGLVPMPWLDTPSALLPVWISQEDGTDFAGDARHALGRVLERFKARDLFPVVATEMEFYLVDDSGDALQVPKSPRSGKRHFADETLAIQALDRFDAFFTDLYDGCEAMDIPADAAISEAGTGQFEINLMHREDALGAADDAWLFKLLCKGMARKHGFAATFMAKPYPDASGNGMHTHFSLLDGAGNNVFDDGTDSGSDLLRHAVGGCMAAMHDCGLIFAPHANSYARLVPDAHAPTGICWGYENRTAAIRIPGGSPKARRIEHRVAGGDVNPYLMLAAVLGAALHGIEQRLNPPAPITGNSYALDLPRIPDTWENAIEAWENSALVAEIFHADLVQNFALTKRQEIDGMAGLSESEQLAIYLDTV